MKSIDLEYFRTPKDWLDSDFGPMLTKSAVYCLQDQGHLPSTKMQVDGEGKGDFWEVNWSSVVDENKAKTLPNENELTQKGCECISLLLTTQLTDYEYFETAQKGTGIDFWLKENPFDMKLDAGLEVSGIRKETPQNTILARAKDKAEQARNNHGDEIIVYISVVEFSVPKVIFKRT